MWPCLSSQWSEAYEPVMMDGSGEVAQEVRPPFSRVRTLELLSKGEKSTRPAASKSPAQGG